MGFTFTWTMTLKPNPPLQKHYMPYCSMPAPMTRVHFLKKMAYTLILSFLSERSHDVTKNDGENRKYLYEAVF